MKVLNLRCAHDHVFEGWFASEDELQAQSERGLVQCPVCGDSAAIRVPSAPRLNVANLREAQTAAPADAQAQAQMRLQSQWMRAVKHLMENTEDVGERFPEEARRIHYGEVEERGIRGQASREAAEALREEGIDVVALPVPEGLKGPIQ